MTLRIGDLPHEQLSNMGNHLLTVLVLFGVSQVWVHDAHIVYKVIVSIVSGIGAFYYALNQIAIHKKNNKTKINHNTKAITNFKGKVPKSDNR